eukprot:6488551-Amphidinium_carterae.1
MPMNPAYYSASYYSGAARSDRRSDSERDVPDGGDDRRQMPTAWNAGLSERGLPAAASVVMRQRDCSAGRKRLPRSDQAHDDAGRSSSGPSERVGPLSANLVCKDYVCVFKDVMTVTAQYIRMSFLLSTNIVGVYCTRIAMMKVGSST